MMIWREFLQFLIRNSGLVVICVILSFSKSVKAQYLTNLDLENYNYSLGDKNYQADSLTSQFPNPKFVLRRSLIIPGWGQVTNKQAWKVPIVYGLLGGLTYYSVYLTKEYHDYRAAYYNSFTTNTDLKFGPTPVHLEGQNAQGLKSNRDFLRNRRDFIYITIFLAYALNAVDAYVFAHLRPFDVSDDLSMNREFIPSSIPTTYYGDIPSISLKIRF